MQDTQPGDLYHPPSRRRSDQSRVQAIAESAQLKVASYIIQMVLTIVVGVTGWSMNTLIERLAAIDGRLNSFAVASALVELRLKNLEAYQLEASQRGGLLRDRLQSVETELKLLQRMGNK